MAEVISKDFSISMQYFTQQNKNPEADSSAAPSFPISTRPQSPDSLLERKSQCSPAANENKVSGVENGDQESWGIFMFLIFVESTVFVCAMSLLITSLTVDKLNDSVLWDLGIWKWCLLVLAIVCGRLIAYLIAEAMLFLIWIFWLDEKVLYFAYGVKKSVMFVIWVSLVTLAWGLLSSVGVKRSKDTTKILHDVTKGLGGCLIGAALWLSKTLLVKFVGSLHATKLFEKIKDAIRLQKILRALSVANKEMQNRGDRRRVFSFRNLFRCFSIADIVEIDSEKNKIALCQQKVHQLLYKMGLKKIEEKKVEMGCMIELINAIRGKRLPPLTYITTKNKDGMLKKEAGENSYSGSSQKDIDDATTLMINDEAAAKTAANDIFSTLAGSENEGFNHQTICSCS